MDKKQDWNDEKRADLLTAIRTAVIGEVRLAKREREEILEFCREALIQDECPESERDGFNQAAVNEFERVESQLESEKATWPAETDCDRLDRIEGALCDRGILLWQASPCCDTCTGAELPDRIDFINDRHPGFRDNVRGYAFFIDQCMPEELAEDTQITVALAYGRFSHDNTEGDSDDYEKKALGIAREVCEHFRAEGFEPDWNGSFDRKISVSVNWQRRTALE